MSYSYLTNVFPEYESSAVYDSRVYPTSVITDSTAAAPPSLAPSLNQIEVDTKTAIPLSYDEQEYMTFAKSLLNDTKKGRNIETFEEVAQEKPTSPQQTNCKVDCDSHINHVIGCTKCTQTLLKQFNIESERLRNEEFMELFSYMIFGVFMLLLMDRLRK